MFKNKTAIVIVLLILACVSGGLWYYYQVPPAPVTDENGVILSDPINMRRAPYIVEDPENIIIE